MFGGFDDVLRVEVQHAQLQTVGFLDLLLVHPDAAADAPVAVAAESVLVLLAGGNGDMTPMSFTRASHT